MFIKYAAFTAKQYYNLLWITFYLNKITLFDDLSELSRE
jgi:hypothetical protein